MNELSNFPKLRDKTINTLRNIAINFESKDLEISEDLMMLAHLARPNGPVIKRKLKQYSKSLNTPARTRLKAMLYSKELAIVPIGFRCSTKNRIRDLLGVVQASLPFDNGFFSPTSVANILKRGKMELVHGDFDTNYAICIKQDNHYDSAYNDGIKFSKSSYEEVDSLTLSPDMEGIGRYLDSTFGYYTLGLESSFILAHYNWHEFAKTLDAERKYNPSENIENINCIFSRRMKRMFDACRNAKYILFIFDEVQHYNYMMIDEKRFDLNDLGVVDDVVKKVFTPLSFVRNLKEVNTAEKVISMLDGTNT